jgi:hypothetical protein
VSECSLKLMEHFHGTRTTVLWFEGDSDTSWGACSDVLIAMTDALSSATGFRIPKDAYRKDAGEFALKGVDFEWSNGIAAVRSDLHHEIIIVSDRPCQRRDAGQLRSCRCPLNPKFARARRTLA